MTCYFFGLPAHFSTPSFKAFCHGRKFALLQVSLHSSEQYSAATTSPLGITFLHCLHFLLNNPMLNTSERILSTHIRRNPSRDSFYFAIRFLYHSSYVRYGMIFVLPFSNLSRLTEGFFPSTKKRTVHLQLISSEALFI